MKVECEELVNSQLEVISRVVGRHIPGLCSLILGGSFARGEGTIIRIGRRWAPFKDYDLFAVVDPHRVRSASRVVPLIRSEIYNALDLDPYSEETPSPGKFQISLEIISSDALHSLPHDLSNLELKLTGRVIWGEELLERIPTELSLVPATSGLRHVLNKLLGLLEQWGPWVDERQAPSQEIALTISYHRAKVLLDLASAILLVRGAWVAGYGARLKRLKELETAGPLLPSIGILAAKVEEALQFKLNPTPPPASDAAFLWEKAKDELLRYVEAISAAVFRYEEGDPMSGHRRFLPRARYGLLAPYAEQALDKLGLTTASWAAKPIVAVYSGVESLRLGQVQLIHPLIRAYACAWAWLADSEAGKNLDFIDRLTMSYPGKRLKTKQSMRNVTVELFKACATRKRRKRIL